MPFMRSESCSFIWHPNVVTWNRFTLGKGTGGGGGSAGVVRGPRLPDDGDLDLAGVLELLLDLASDLVREQDRAVVVECARADHHADLAAGLHGVDLVDAVVAGRGVLEGAGGPDVLLERLAARAGGCAGGGGGGVDDHGPA